MLVGMRVWLTGIDAGGVLVLMVLVVDVRMSMGEPVMVVLVQVPLAEVQPHPSQHQDSRDGQSRRDRLTEQEDGHGGTHKWREREVGARPGRPKVPQRQHEPGQADPITDEADDQLGHDGGRRRAVGGAHRESDRNVDDTRDRALGGRDRDGIAAREVLMEHEPGDERREHAFEVQQQ